MPVGLYFDYGRSYRPFRLKRMVEDYSESWLGGTHHAGVRPQIVNSLTRHLCTLTLDENEAVALFASFDYEAIGEFNFFRSTYKLLGKNDPIIQFVVHSKELPLDGSSELRSDMPALKLSFSEMADDPVCLTPLDLGTEEIYSDHKVGGMPYFEQIEGEVSRGLELMASGWVHLLQLTFPGRDDDETPGSWPFGESAFHVFCYRDRSEYHFKYCWG